LSATLRPLEPGDESWLADLHNRAFSDYALPARLDAAALATYMGETGVRHDLSFVAFVDDRPASFCLGALREGRASVRGEGTDPQFRRRGLGAMVLEATVEAATAAGASSVSLEVLDGNDAALGLYERHGFERRRMLLGYEVEPPRPSLRMRMRGGLDTMAGQVAVRVLDSWGWPDPPWQLTPASLERLPALSLSGDAVVIGRRRGSRFWLYALSVHPARRGRGLGARALAALGAETIAIPALLPDEWAGAHAFLAAMGALPDSHRQWEMTRVLGA
jgi:ribosomal protein S18 acetylase RimI-like enzyme